MEIFHVRSQKLKKIVKTVLVWKGIELWLTSGIPYSWVPYVVTIIVNLSSTVQQLHTYPHMSRLGRGQQTFFVKRQIVIILGIVGHMISSKYSATKYESSSHIQYM